MGAFTYIETDTGTNVDIHAATAIGSYTATGDKLIMVDVSIDAVAGNGDYVMYVTRQIGGSGSAYRILPQTTMAAASGLTAISAQSGWITVRNGDVLTCYVVGLAGDTTTPDWTTRWFELADTDISNLATTAHVQEVEDKVDIVDGIADAILDDTGTTGVLLSTSALGSIFDDEVIVGTYTFSDLLKIMAAALAGKATGGGTTSVTFRGVDDASDVIVATVDANGNRSAVTLTV
jgi:hypothetical protein